MVSESYEGWNGNDEGRRGPAGRVGREGNVVLEVLEGLSREEWRRARDSTGGVGKCWRLERCHVATYIRKG